MSKWQVSSVTDQILEKQKTEQDEFLRMIKKAMQIQDNKEENRRILKIKFKSLTQLKQPHA